MSITRRKIRVGQRSMSEGVIFGLLLLCVAGIVSIIRFNTGSSSKLTFRVVGCVYTNKMDIDSIASRWSRTENKDLYHLQSSITHLPMVESVIVTKETSSEVSICITERKPYVAYLNNNEILYVDKHQVSIPHKFANKSTNVPMIRVNTSKNSEKEMRRVMVFGWRVVNMFAKYNIYEYLGDISIDGRTAIMSISGTDAVLLLSESNLERGVQMFGSFLKDRNVNQRIGDVDYLDARYRNQMAVAEKSKHTSDTVTNQVLCMNAATE